MHESFGLKPKRLIHSQWNTHTGYDTLNVQTSFHRSGVKDTGQ